MIRAVVFDLDDTLYPERDFALSGFAAVSDWLTREQGISGLFERLQLLFDRRERGKLFDTALAGLGTVPTPELIERLVTVYRTHRPKLLRLHSDAAEVIRVLEANKTLGMITDGYLQTQQNKVEALGISNRFRDIIYSDAFGREHWKPSSTPYLRWMDATGCSGPECVYLADNPAKDFITAKKLGWKTVRVRRPDGEYCRLEADAAHRADWSIRSLLEFPPILRSLDTAE